MKVGEVKPLSERARGLTPDQLLELQVYERALASCGVQVLPPTTEAEPCTLSYSLNGVTTVPRTEVDAMQARHARQVHYLKRIIASAIGELQGAISGD